MQVLAQAVEAANSLDNEAIRYTMLNSSFVTVLGTIGFNDDGLPTGTFPVVQWQNTGNRISRWGKEQGRHLRLVSFGLALDSYSCLAKKGAAMQLPRKGRCQASTTDGSRYHCHCVRPSTQSGALRHRLTLGRLMSLLEPSPGTRSPG